MFRRFILGLTLALIPFFASAQLLLTGVGMTPGGGTPYIPGAVTFSPSVSYGVAATLSANCLVVAPACVGRDTSQFVAMYWFYGSMGYPGTQVTTTPTTPGNADTNWSTWLLNQWRNIGHLNVDDSEGTQGIGPVTDNSTSNGTVRYNSVGAPGITGGGTKYGTQDIGFNSTTQAAWHQIIWVVDSAVPRGAIYIDGVNRSQTFTGTTNTVFALNSAYGFYFNNGSGLMSGATSGGYNISDFYLNTNYGGNTSWPGCAALIDGSGNLCPAMLASFVSGTGASAKPVDMGTNCTLPSGAQPELCFSGNKTTWLTNKGNAQATLALTDPVASELNSPVLFNAPYGPSGPPTDRPYFTWAYSAHMTSPGASAANFIVAGCSCTTAAPIINNGNPIAVGDLLILEVGLGDVTTAVDRNIQIASGTGNVWTALNSTGSSVACASGAGSTLPCHVTVSAKHPMNYALYSHIADSNDVTAAGSAWTNAPQVSWTTNANALKQASWALYDYKNASSVQAISNTVASDNTISTPAALTVTSTTAPTLLVTLSALWSSVVGVAPPTTQELRYRNLGAAGRTFLNHVNSDEVLAASGATGGRTETQTGNEASMVTNLVLVK